MTEPAAQPPTEQRFVIEISPDVEPGVHADFASIWHTPDTFVLDFASLRQPPQLSQDENTGQRVLICPTRIVSRIKIPPDQVFELMKALEKELSTWELQTGRRGTDGPGLPNPG
jgi:hypothetical protein